MTFATSTLRPGLLVSLSVSSEGNVSYDKVDLENMRTNRGAAVAKWETTRTIDDPDELERARKAQSKARSAISSVCVHTAHGLLCPTADRDLLDRAIAEARNIVETFNSTANITRVRLYVMTGEIAQDDLSAVQAINREVADLLETMARGVNNLDVRVIRDAADRAKQVGGMLTPDAEARIQLAVDTARKVAVDIVKAGEAAAMEIDRAAIRKITEQRTAFLDFGEVQVAKPAAQARAVDFSPK